MSNIMFYKKTKSEIDDIPIREGNILFDTTNKDILVDNNGARENYGNGSAVLELRNSVDELENNVDELESSVDNVNDGLNNINVYVNEEDGKLHFVDKDGADTELPFKSKFEPLYNIGYVNVSVTSRSSTQKVRYLSTTEQSVIQDIERNGKTAKLIVEYHLVDTGDTSRFIDNINRVASDTNANAQIIYSSLGLCVNTLGLETGTYYVSVYNYK